jgi:hypothetical protein
MMYICILEMPNCVWSHHLSIYRNLGIAQNWWIGLLKFFSFFFAYSFKKLDLLLGLRNVACTWGGGGKLKWSGEVLPFCNLDGTWGKRVYINVGWFSLSLSLSEKHQFQFFPPLERTDLV